jgi:hypothetical protein
MLDNSERDKLLVRILALEHLLEMGYATWMAQMTTPEYLEFERQFEKRLRTAWPEDTEWLGAVAEVGDEVIRDAQANAARFWKRAKDRERTIRNARKLAK